MKDVLPVTVEDGTFDAYVFPAAGSAPVVVLLQEVFGVNDGIRRIASELVAEGFTVVAPDLFWRAERGLQLSSHDEADVKRAFAIYGDLDFDRTAADVIATVDASRALSKNGKVAVMGFCLGGLMTFLTAARGKVDAAVEYYGGGTQNYLSEAGNVRSPLLIHLAGGDEYVPADAQKAIRDAADVNPSITVHVYAGRDHAFVRPGGDHYHEADALAANARTIAFLKTHLA
jgi:carboxymethylenebutenolidase